MINHTGQFPSVTISFNLAPGTAIGQAVSAIQTAEKGFIRRSPSRPASGNAGVRSILSSTPILILASLFVIYIILGVLYERQSTRSPSSQPCHRPASRRIAVIADGGSHLI